MWQTPSGRTTSSTVRWPTAHSRAAGGRGSGTVRWSSGTAVTVRPGSQRALDQDTPAHDPAEDRHDDGEHRGGGEQLVHGAEVQGHDARAPLARAEAAGVHGDGERLGGEE